MWWYAVVGLINGLIVADCTPDPWKALVLHVVALLWCIYGRLTVSKSKA